MKENLCDCPDKEDFSSWCDRDAVMLFTTAVADLVAQRLRDPRVPVELYASLREKHTDDDTLRNALEAHVEALAIQVTEMFSEAHTRKLNWMDQEDAQQP